MVQEYNKMQFGNNAASLQQQRKKRLFGMAQSSHDHDHQLS